MYICGQFIVAESLFLRNWQFPEGWLQETMVGWRLWPSTNFLTTEDEFDRIRLS